MSLKEIQKDFRKSALSLAKSIDESLIATKLSNALRLLHFAIDAMKPLPLSTGLRLNKWGADGVEITLPRKILNMNADGAYWLGVYNVAGEQGIRWMIARFFDDRSISFQTLESAWRHH